MQVKQSFGVSLAGALLLFWGCGVQELPRPSTEPPATGGGSGAGGAPASRPDETPSRTGGTTGAASGSGGAPTGTSGSGGRSSAPSDDGSAGAPGVTPDAAPPATPDPPAAGAGIMIAGRFVPKDKALVVLHIGHSNMAGRASTPAELKPEFYDIHPQFWIYGQGAAIRPAQEPTAPDNQDGQAAGPGMALLHAVLAVAPPGAQVLSIGHGHSGSFAGYCSNFRKGGLFYDLVMKPATELKGKVTFTGIFAMFGQSEHNASIGQQKSFADCLAAVASDMRGDLGEADLPFMLGEYEAGLTKPGIEPTSAFGTAIIAQIKMVPDKVTRAALIPTNGVSMQDDHHYNLAGHKLWSQRAVQILVDRGWAPWSVASTKMSAP
jgi:hypothetical protein